ncbi:hypothetical protein [Spirosoma jeollabukense]
MEEEQPAGTRCRRQINQHAQGRAIGSGQPVLLNGYPRSRRGRHLELAQRDTVHRQRFPR